MKNLFYSFIKYKYIHVSIALLTLIACNYNTHETKELAITNKDSLELWLEQSKSRKLTLQERGKALKKAYEETSFKKNDSIQLHYFSKIAIQAEILNDDSLFKIVNLKNLNLAKKLKNTLKVGDAYWNYGVYYQKKEVIDSAYYHFHKAYVNFKEINHELYTAKMLYNLAYIQGRIKDYTGSEVSLFEAIPIFEKLDRPENLYQCYNYLGIVYGDLEEINRSIFYHNKALEYLDKFDSSRNYREGSYSNLGIAHQKQHNYKKAITYFKKALSNKRLKQINIHLYARLVDNLAYTQFLNGDTTHIETTLNYALNIRDSLNRIAATAISKRHLAELYAAKNDTLKAILFAKESFNSANQIENNRDKLENLLLLSKIDSKNTNNYLKEYVYLSDSLQIEERKTRNKFTRLRFETDEYIEETEKLSQQKIWISAASFIAILILISAYVITAQQARNKKLLFDREQQKSNEEIYSLMLKQQSKLEEGRMKERHRISEDLHDGVLGKIFGTRLGLGFLNINADEDTNEKLTYFTNELQSIEKEIRTISHELKSEILSSKEDFFKIIEDLIKQKSNLGELEYQFKFSEEIVWDDIKDGIKINIYRIIQEGLQNIIKYAKASEIDIELELEDNQLTLTINDNGVGFNINDKRKGIGIKNMTSRTNKINGTFSINSIINKGTSIVVSCPIKNKKDEQKL